MLKSSKKIGKMCIISYIFVWAFIGFTGFVTIPGSNWKETLEINSLSMEVINSVWCVSMAFSVVAWIFEMISSDTSLKEDVIMFLLYGAALYGINYLMFATGNFVWLTLYAAFMLLMSMGIECYCCYRKKKQVKKHE